MRAKGKSLTQTNLYLKRINAVLNYVREHLEDELSLDTLAQVAGFSPFHFHRIFTSLTGETVNDLVTRLRLERAVALLRATPTLSLSDAAFACGFHSLSVFSRTFKKHYELNPRQWDRQNPLKHSKNHQVSEGVMHYTRTALADFAHCATFTVRLISMPAQRLASVRVYDAYGRFSQVQEAYHHLMAWYCRNGGDAEEMTLYGMSQDDPDVTPLRLCRFDWCVRVPADWQAEGDMSISTFPACEVAAIHCYGDSEQEEMALQYLFRYWLPRSSYQPANLPAMEIYRQPPSKLGWERYDMDCAVPIMPL